MLAAEIGLAAPPRTGAERPASDPAGTPNALCQRRSGPIDARRLATAASSAPVPAESGDIGCATALPPRQAADGPARDAVAGGVPPYNPPGAMRDPRQGSLNAGESRLYRDSMPASVIGLFGQFGFIRDRISNARRARLRFGFQPAPHIDLGLCATDGFGPILATGLSGRCLATVESEISYVFALGRADFLSRGEIGGVGGKVQYDLSAPIGDGAALVTGLSYRRVPTIIGRAPDLRRLEGAITYRCRFAEVIGVDLGLTGGRGTEPRSLMQENKVQVRLGLTF